MDPQRYARVKEVFREAMRWAPAEQAAVVAELAGEDTALRDEVMSLLAHHDDAPLIRDAAPRLAPAGATAAAEVAEVATEVAETAAAAAPAAPASAIRTLADRLREERGGREASGPPWPLDRVIRALDPIARALAAAADRGEVHGAVRADHLRCAEADGEPALELIAAGAGERGRPEGSSTATRLETAEARSAAPEQLTPALGPVGPWSDVYSLALLCVDLLLGRPPVGRAASAMLARVRDESAQPTPRAVGLALPPAVEAVLAMALAMRPIERYQDADRFWTALRQAAEASRAAPAPASAPPAPSPAAAGPALRRRGRLPLGARLMIAVGAATAAALVATALARCG